MMQPQNDQMNLGMVITEEYKVPDRMVGLSKFLFCYYSFQIKTDTFDTVMLSFPHVFLLSDIMYACKLHKQEVDDISVE